MSSDGQRVRWRAGTVILVSLVVAATAASADEVEDLRARALAGSPAWSIVESLVTEVGARPTGSPAMLRARDWAAQKLTGLGFENVHVESFVKENAWVRGAESAAIVSPISRRLAIAGLGNSAPTPASGIEAELTCFSSLPQLIAAPPGSLSGKIALVNHPMVRTQNEEGYRSAARARTEGPALAAARGAVAYLTRSITASDAPLPHTGLTRFPAGSRPIPAAALAVPDADLLARLAARGVPVRVRLSLSSSVIPRADAWNVVGELRGRETPDEIVLIGGHLDSWDLSESASDDGAGVAIATAAASLIGTLPHRPRRTIRVVLWGSEETEGSGAAYAVAHAAEAHKIVLAVESDFGAGRAYRLALPPVDAADPRVGRIAAALAPLGAFISADSARAGGSDVEDLRKKGVPVASFNQEQSGYFDVHHSAADTLSRITRSDLDQVVAAWAVLVYLVAESDLDFRAAAP
ncbi:MAG TPA: M28 family peptidase [Steroidobacteraceae bacterium]|nr:M28 family peptidase [Steroidobacteraceae bacterium]